MSYTASQLLKAQAFIPTIFEQKFERRRAISQIMQIFLKGQSAIPVQELARMKSSPNRTTEILYRTRKDFTSTLNTSKGVSPSGETGATAAVTLSWELDKAFEVLHETKKYANNQISAEEGLAYDLLEGEASYWFGAANKEKQLADYLLANRTQINVNSDGKSQNTWKPTADFFMEVAKTDESLFINYLVPEMLRNKYTGMLDVITDLMYKAPLEYYQAQGNQNGTNYAFQFRNVNFAASAFITPDSGYKTNAFVVPEGGVAMVTWNEGINIKGEDDGQYYWGTYPSKFFPGINFDVFAKREAKQSTTDYQDRVINFEFTLWNAKIIQPLSGGSGETPIFQYQIKNS